MRGNLRRARACPQGCGFRVWGKILLRVEKIPQRRSDAERKTNEFWRLSHVLCASAGKSPSVLVGASWHPSDTSGEF